MSAAIPSYGVDTTGISILVLQIMLPMSSISLLNGRNILSRIGFILLPQPCLSSIKDNVIEALHDPTVKASIMSQFLAGTLLGDMPVTNMAPFMLF